MKPDPRRVVARYTGNPDGKPIYPNEIDHGYEDPIAGGSDVMQDLVNDLRHEQGNPRLAAVSQRDIPRPREDWANDDEMWVTVFSGPRGDDLHITWSNSDRAYIDRNSWRGPWKTGAELLEWLNANGYRAIGVDKS